MNSLIAQTNQTRDTPRDTSKLDSVLCELDDASAALHQYIDSLENRLATLLEPKICGDGESNKREAPFAAQSPCAPLIAKINNQTDIVGNAADRISFLLSRLCA